MAEVLVHLPVWQLTNSPMITVTNPFSLLNGARTITQTIDTRFFMKVAVDAISLK
jgi:hypothetical protein